MKKTVTWKDFFWMGLIIGVSVLAVISIAPKVFFPLVTAMVGAWGMGMLTCLYLQQKK